MEQVKQIDIDGVQYTMTPANAMASWQALKNALKLANNVHFTGSDKQQIGASVISSLLSNLGDPSLKALEDIVLNHTTTIDENGKPFRLSQNPDKHFNQYRSHLLQVLVEGVKYQFGDFFSGGGKLLNAMLPAVNPIKA